MRTIVHLTLLFAFLSPVKGQKNTKFYVSNQSRNTISFSETINIPIEYKEHTDTITINSLEIHESMTLQYDSLIILDSIQIDGIGAKEVVFCRKMNYSESVHGGTFDGMQTTSLEIIEIRNLDTKEQYWGAVTFYCYQFLGSYNCVGTKLFKYNFTIDRSGNIEISNESAARTDSCYEIDNNSTVYKIIPKLKVGRYHFEDGKYIMNQ